MISNRYRRSSKPVESLKQFDLTANKGIDVTASPTANGTYAYIENFDIAEDGSLELRKPMVLSRLFDKQTVTAPYADQIDSENRTYRLYRVFPTYDKDKLLLVYKCESLEDTGYWGISIYDRETETYSAPVMFIGYNYDTRTQIEVQIPSNNGVGVVPIDLSDAHLTTTFTSCILTNCKVCTSYPEDAGSPYNLPDLSLKHYVSFPDTDFDYKNLVQHAPRNIQIYQNDAGEWLVKVISAEIPNLVFADGELPIDPRLAADNPYALRDTYNSPYPTVKGIAAYTYGRRNPDGTYTPVPKNNICLTVPCDIEFDAGTVYYDFGTYAPVVIAYDYNDHALVDKPVTIEASEAYPYPFTFNIPGDEEHVAAYGELYVNIYDTETGYLVGTSYDYPSLTPEDKIEYYFDIRHLLTPDTVLHARMEFYFADPDDFERDVSTDVNRSPIIGLFRNGRIAQLTEDVSTPEAFAIVNSVGNDVPPMVLKAFCNFRSEDAYPTPIVAFWERSSDGKLWYEFPPLSNPGYSLTVKVPNPYYDVNGEETTPPEDVEITYRNVTAYRIYDRGYASPSIYNKLSQRVDISGILRDISSIYRFTMLTAKWDNETETYVQDRLLGQSQYTFNKTGDLELAISDFGNASQGKGLYYNSRLYTYGTEKGKNNVFSSEAGTLVQRLSNMIDLNAYSDVKVTALVPWRDYLIAATDSSLHLITKNDNGYYSKTLNTAVGIPEEDGDCCAATLNGVIFKSGTHVYMLYPNLYSGTDTVLNVTDISKPIEGIIDKNGYNRCFAFGTEDAYYLCLSKETLDNTVCLKYNYVNKTWTKFVYPTVFQDYSLVSLNDIRVYSYAGTYVGIAEYNIERDFDQNFIESNQLYRDYVILKPSSDPDQYQAPENHSYPIHFVVDTGQKVDELSYTKQFTESKLVFSTEHSKDRFPMSVRVLIDGNNSVIKLDANTDSPLWESTETGLRDETLAIASANGIQINDSDIVHTFRQMFLRYAGKGRSVRLYIVGDSEFKFRLYEILTRYRRLNVKQ